MKLKMNEFVLSLSVVLLLSGCGGGNGGGDDKPSDVKGTADTTPPEVVDTTPPEVVVEPSSGQTISVEQAITFTFNEAMDQESVALSGSVESEASELVWNDEQTLVLRPDPQWTEKLHLSITVNGKDEAGVAMAEVALTYTVEDKTPPSGLMLAPEHLVLQKQGPIVIRFSESMDTESLVLEGDLALESTEGEWSSTDADNDTLTVEPATRWTSGTARSLVVRATDTSGNPVAEIHETFVVPLIFENHQSAELVIGQPDFLTSGGGVDAATVDSPYGSIAVDDEGQLFIGDYGNNRVLGYLAVPQASGAAADFVLGQPDAFSEAPATSQTGMGGPQQVSMGGGRMAVAEYENNRVLIYNEVPRDGTAIPDVVVGQMDFDSAETPCDANHFHRPETVALAGDKLVVTDASHNRVLIWNSVPTSNGAAPDLVLGQASLDTCTHNDDAQDGTSGPATARTLNEPAGVWTDGQRLVVADSSNHRVLIWNTFPSEHFQPADLVLGQVDFSTTVENDADGDGSEDDTPTSRTFNFPYDGIWSNGVQLFVADSSNNRILMWNSWPEENFAAADRVLGQSDFTEVFGKTDDKSFRSPAGVFGWRDFLFVNDVENDRVMVFRSQ